MRHDVRRVSSHRCPAPAGRAVLEVVLLSTLLPSMIRGHRLSIPKTIYAPNATDTPPRPPSRHPRHARAEDADRAAHARLRHRTGAPAPLARRDPRRGGLALPGAP